MANEMVVRKNRTLKMDEILKISSWLTSQPIKNWMAEEKPSAQDVADKAVRMGILPSCSRRNITSIAKASGVSIYHNRGTFGGQRSANNTRYILILANALLKLYNELGTQRTAEFDQMLKDTFNVRAKFMEG